MGTVRALIRDHIDVVGLQEVQPDQRYTLARAAGPRWTQYPRPGRGGDNRLLWRNREFRLVTTRPMTIPYFNGHLAQAPAVLLEHRATKQRVWVLSIHNPAETGTYHHQGTYRSAALQVERTVVKRLSRWGYPVLLTGDFNDRGRAFCAMTDSDLMTSAFGSRSGSACHAPERSQIDWIFGIGTRFGRYRVDVTPIHEHVSDHPLIRARVDLPSHGKNTVTRTSELTRTSNTGK